MKTSNLTFQPLVIWFDLLNYIFSILYLLIH